MIFPEVAQILSEIIGIGHEEITPDMPLTIDYGIEPVQIAKLVIQCEQEFKVTIHDEDVHMFHCAGDIALYIEKRLTEGREDSELHSDQERTMWYYR